MSAKVILKNGKKYEEIDSLEVYTAIDYVGEGVEKNEIEFVLRNTEGNAVCVAKADRLGGLVIKGGVGKLDSDINVHVIGNVDFLKAECAYVEGTMSGTAGGDCVVESNPTMKLLSLEGCFEGGDIVVEGDLSKVLIRINGYSNEAVSVIGGVVSLYGDAVMVRGDAKLGRVEERLVVQEDFTGNWEGHKLVDEKWVVVEDKEAC